MKKTIEKTAALAVLVLLTGCGAGGAKVVESYDPGMGNDVIKSYSEMSDGTWECGGAVYDNCKEVKDEANGTTYIVLTNGDDVTAEQASDSMENGTALTDAVVVEMRQ